ncbi:MAG: ABC transporter substrate-binding protein [Polyangiaceae bacterium]|nr:ABC transporter substrate-binding protein [Polyangiaceae bacterium]
MRTPLRRSGGASLVTVLAGAAVIVAVGSCSPTFQPKSCAQDGDCGTAKACVSEAAGTYCKDVKDAPIRVGMSAPISGTSAELGIEMRAGVDLAFAEQTKKGGVNGRAVKLDFRDDGYEPPNAEAAAKELTDAQPAVAGVTHCPETTLKSQDANPTPVSTTGLARGPNAVLALLGNVGTPTMVRAAPVAVETGTLYFGAFTGAAAILRDGRAGVSCSKYVFNVRASYAQEARAALEYFIKLGVKNARHVISFDQNDGFGDAGYTGLTKAYADLSSEGGNGLAPLGDGESIARFRYKRNDTQSVLPAAQQAIAQLTSLLAGNTDNHVVGILMTDTYTPAATFIREIRNWQYGADPDNTKKADRLTIIFNNVSFVGPNALAKKLRDDTAAGSPRKPYSDNVFVSQVVPNYDSDQGEVSRQYRNLVKDAGLEPSFTSFEGYIAGRIFVAGLLNNKGLFTPDAMVTALETMPDLALGLGGAARFTAQSHNYLKSIWVTAINADARFTNRYYWSDKGTTAISIEEF